MNVQQRVSVKRLVQAYGSKVVKADAKEAEAMVRVPKEEEAVSYRRIPDMSLAE